MRSIFLHIIALLVFSTTLILGGGCDKTPEFSNTPPGGIVITKNLCYLGPGDAVVLSGRAEDADGDPLEYRWSAEEGTLTPADGAGPVVTWQAPGSHGTYEVTLVVTDGIDSSSRSIDIDVGRNLDVLHEGGVLDEKDYPYIVPNNVPLRIASLVTVTIKEGVTIVFNEGTGGLDVRGTLVAEGTEQERILFIPNSCPGEQRVWKGLFFSGDEASGIFGYVTVTSSRDGITVEDGASFVADHIVVDLSSSDGLTVKTRASAEISDSRFWDNGGGVFAVDATALINGTSIRYNGNYGLSVLESSGGLEVVLAGCVVANNTMNGFVMGGTASPVISGCSIFLNGPNVEEPGTVRFLSTYAGTDPVDMTGNYWGVDTAAEIEAQIKREGANGEVDYSGFLTAPPVHD